jgi:hypothetical protein
MTILWYDSKVTPVSIPFRALYTMAITCTLVFNWLFLFPFTDVGRVCMYIIKNVARSDYFGDSTQVDSIKRQIYCVSSALRSAVILGQNYLNVSFSSSVKWVPIKAHFLCRHSTT